MLRAEEINMAVCQPAGAALCSAGLRCQQRTLPEIKEQTA